MPRALVPFVAVPHFLTISDHALSRDACATHFYVLFKTFCSRQQPQLRTIIGFTSKFEWLLTLCPMDRATSPMRRTVPSYMYIRYKVTRVHRYPLFTPVTHDILSLTQYGTSSGHLSPHKNITQQSTSVDRVPHRRREGRSPSRCGGLSDLFPIQKLEEEYRETGTFL